MNEGMTKNERVGERSERRGGRSDRLEQKNRRRGERESSGMKQNWGGEVRGTDTRRKTEQGL